MELHWKGGDQSGGTLYRIALEGGDQAGGTLYGFALEGWKSG